MTTGPITDPAAAAAPPLTALGKVISAGDGNVNFAPAGTNYQLKLVCPEFAGPLNVPVRGVVRVAGRKLWTVPSGGNFISPIFGTPRIVQGRVRLVEPRRLVVQAGCCVWINLPNDDSAYDLANGVIRVGCIVNVTALPGAAFELAR